MTSALKKWGQIDSRIKYFMAFGDVSGWNYAGEATDLLDSTTAATEFTRVRKISANSLMKDLGRSITVYNDGVVGYPHTMIYRQIQLVNGSTTGGVGGTPANGYNSYWIKVWSDTGADIAKVARTG